MLQENKHLPSDRKFGLTFAVIFLGLGVYSVVNTQTIIACLFFVGAVILCALSVIHAKTLAPFNRLWMRFGELLQKLVSPIVLIALYFIIFTPVGLITRAFGRDELKIRKNAKITNWEQPNGRGATRSSLKQQF